MLRDRPVSVAVLIMGVATALCLGCAAPSTTSGAGETAPSELPRWVRIVPAHTAERAFYVGGVSVASDVEGGIAEAFEDALRQIRREADLGINELYAPATARVRSTVSSTERTSFRVEIQGEYGDRLVAVACQDSVYHRPCGPGGGGGPVCQLYVLVSVSAVDRHRILAEVLTESHDYLRGAEQSGLAEMAEAMLRYHVEGPPERDGHERR